LVKWRPRAGILEFISRSAFRVLRGPLVGIAFSIPLRSLRLCVRRDLPAGIRVAENTTTRGEIAMEETRENTTRMTRKPYAKPEVSQIQLRPEEAVLGFCKSTSRSGPVRPVRCSSPFNCLSLGS